MNYLMVLEKSTWLNLSFVEKILRKSEENDSIQVIDMSIKPATKKGDNYLSDMVRITIEFSRNQGGHEIKEKKSIIVKLVPIVENIRQKFVILAGCFHTEISMLSNTLNKMNKLLGSKYRLSGKSLYVQNEHPTLLVMEDLMFLGFRMADRLSGLDLAHSVLALQGLARFHAASVAVCEKEPKQKEYSKGLFYHRYPPELQAFFIMGIKALADEIANWPEVKKYSEKIAKLSDHVYKIAEDAVKSSEDELNVINHGDCHLNNMLFKYDNDGKPIDQIFVDFQMCVYTTPALDLHYFLNTSPSIDVMENERNTLLSEYLGTLSATMKQLNCKTQPPTMEELKAILKRSANYGMIASFTILPLMLCSKSESKDLDEIMGTGTFINPGLQSESYKELMIKRIPLYDEWGLLG
ncbi:PREDICTED: uncharacterized protein LOC108766094 isoform X2 [Trachymyrmex cornetzi]|uniref:uncharacterized protein LOC108766094 isoform X2 n=1 Tax=Trachymyrmex cornetzi TaxID=471704 RepID=UPI00084F722E|nr:PREDICTED: uncharacterized protein LOC108766094 isoform X2 [Trachymyrmex cornetzi]